MRLTVPADGLAVLPWHVPGRLTRLAVENAVELDSGRFAVELGMESVAVATDQLCAIAGVEVLEPPALRASLRRLGEALAGGNAPPGRPEEADVVRLPADELTAEVPRRWE